MEKRNIRLIALDMDGTLLDSAGEITEENKKAIKAAVEEGIYVIISSGRPVSGIKPEEVSELGVRYAITTNGALVCQVPDGKELIRNVFANEVIMPVVRKLMEWRICVDLFTGGKVYISADRLGYYDELGCPDSVKEYLKATRIPVEDVETYFEENHLEVEKITLNFCVDENGSYLCRDEVKAFLEAEDRINLVTGGFNNLELTRSDVSKGIALGLLCDYLGIDIAETMAIGDTQNDRTILEATGVGVAMGNSDEDIKAMADFVTETNDNSGVAKAIYEIALGK